MTTDRPIPEPGNEDTRADSEEEEQPKLRRFRHVKKYAVMLAECETYVTARKRLPILHSRWLLNRYINCQTASMAGIESHNRMVDELREAQNTIIRLQRQLEAKEPS